MADPVEEPAEQRTDDQERRDDQQRPGGGLGAADRDEEGHGEDVLQDQHADGDAAGDRRGFVALLQDLDGEHGGAEGEGEPDDDQADGVEVGGQREAEPSDEPEQASHPGGGQDREGGGGAPDLRRGQRADPQLQADAEEQQEDPDVGDDLDGGGGLEPEPVEDEPGGDVPDQRGQPNGARKEAEPEGGQQERDVHGCGSSPVSRTRTSPRSRRGREEQGCAQPFGPSCGSR